FLGFGPALFALRSDAPPAALQALRTVRLGEDRLEDPDGVLARTFGRRTRWVLVRPDGHAAFARRSSRGLERCVRRALGIPARAPLARFSGGSRVDGAPPRPPRQALERGEARP
ncbi:MAG: hypothetical protein ACK4N5_04990, partial [Myxococcales bacterium]